MTHRIKSVQPLKNFVLLVIFQNGVEKKYDMNNVYPILPQFRAFEHIPDLFKQVHVDVGGYGVSWNDELDLDAEDIWENGIETGICYEIDIFSSLAENLARARDIAGMTQKQLSDITGIYQGDISKIERGLANPSLSTLERLADGLSMKLKIEFTK